MPSELNRFHDKECDYFEYRQNKRPIRGHSTYTPGVRQCRKAAEAAANYYK